MNAVSTEIQARSGARVKHFSTVGDVLDWYAPQDKGCLAALRERQRIRTLFKAAFGHLAVDEAEPYDLLDFIRKHTADNNWTRRRWRSAIARPFNVAADERRIAGNPFRAVTFPLGGCGRDWTDAEYQAILRASPAYFRRLIVFVRFGGARPGEAKDLEWKHIHEELDAIVLPKHKTSYRTAAPRRIHFNHVLVKLLFWLQRHKRHARYVFTNKFGRPWTTQSVTKHLRSLRERVGLSAEVKLNGGRHTFCTVGLMNGVDIATMGELLGHQQLQTTQRYAHLVNKRKYLNAAADQAIGRKK